MDYDKKIKYMQNQIDFLLYELRRLKESRRWEEFGRGSLPEIQRTKESFDYQWDHLPTGANLPSDNRFMDEVKSTILSYLGGVEESFLSGKKVADVGCGLGRFTYGLLSMGAKVTAMDQSLHGLEQVKKLCKKWEDHLRTDTIDLLNARDTAYNEAFDIVWCYGVVHHTGNTYLAMDTACRMLRHGGTIFMMVYGFPENDGRFREINLYEKLRFGTRNMNHGEKVKYLRSVFPEEQVHGYFDAISPQINDILSFDEITNFMTLEGFVDIRRTYENDNIHFVATKA